MKTEERVAKIDEMCQELFAANTMFTPIYPWIFVMVCQKAQQVGGIYLPEKQNKTAHEGIVLATWKEKLIGGRGEYVSVRSEMRLGDRVTFHHFAGQPIPGYDSDRFRVVKERDWKEEGGIFGRIDYADADTKPIEQLQRVLLDKANIKIAELMGKIGDRFLVVDREAGSVTLSGV
jgi:co-chaperonin GroES (HSP10)